MVSCKVFSLTLFTTASIVGVIGAFAMIKHEMAKELQLTQTFLGFIDGLSFLGRVFGNLYLMIYPLQKPKRAYTIQALFQTFLLLAIFYVIHEIHSAAKLLLVFGMLVSAFGRAFLVVPTLINTNNSNPTEDSFQLSLWFVFTFLGDVIAVLLVQWLLTIGVHWNYAFMIFMILFLVTVLLQHFFIDEVEESVHRQENICQYISHTFNVIKAFLSEPKHLFWEIDAMLISNLYYIVLMWFPYYFSKLGFLTSSSTISIMYPIATCFGTIVIGALVTKFIRLREIFITGFYLLNLVAIIFFITIQPTQEAIPKFMILTGAMGFFVSYGYSHTDSAEMAELTQGNEEVRFHVINFTCLFIHILTTIFMVIVGWVMQKDLKNLFYVLLGNSLLFTIIHIFRKAYFTQEYRNHEETFSESS